MRRTIGSGNNDGWFTLDFPDYEWSSTAPFVIALTNIFGSNNVDTIYTDADGRSDNGLYFELVSGVWSLITPPPSGDLMVRVYFSGTPVESTSLGEIKAVFK
ncbi:MAG: hypothetical protein GY771_04475 [bacterium]|nr:hypothetical protein [bacterium]